MNMFLMSVIRVIVAFLVSAGILQTPYAEFTPVENRVYTDGELSVEPDPSKYVKLTAADEGFDIYNPEKGSSFGYRYGPSMIMNADGSIDAYFSAPGVSGEWDWITYRHSPDSGKTWTEEKAVLMPTPESADFYSCCDPGAFKMGEYYYIGYTSTVVDGGIDNDVFVARSKNPDGPFEKWNGNGWGGKPSPIIEYTGDKTTYGAGEPSFVVLDGTLYIYYTWRDGAVNQTRVSLADATIENWPETIEYQGIAMTHRDGAFDSADVKYVEDFGKFIGVITFNRFTTDSCIGVYCSDDGLTFKESNAIRTNISHCCHNCGITSRPDGHIRLSDGIYLAYAYGDQWGYWPTRMNKVQLSLADAPDFSDMENPNTKTPVRAEFPSCFENITGISSEQRVYEKSLSDGSFEIPLMKVNTAGDCRKIRSGITFDGYDKKIISVDGDKIVPMSQGETVITAHWKNYYVDLAIKITG